jgi:hypothetical protein
MRPLARGVPEAGASCPAGLFIPRPRRAIAIAISERERADRGS